MLLGLRIAIATLVILATAFWGLVITFSDPPAAWSVTRWVAYLVASHLPSAFVIGALVPRKWQIALLAGISSGLLLLGFRLFLPAAVLFGAIALTGNAGARATRLFSRASLVAALALVTGCFPSLRQDDVWKHSSYAGVVLDEQTNQPLSRATVLWVERGKSVVTDDSGRFLLPGEHGPPVTFVGLSDQVQNRTLLVTHPEYQNRRLVLREVLYTRPVTDIGEIALTRRNATLR